MDVIRCGWCGTDQTYIDYHDKEWGKAVYDDATIFELMVLESFQSGLSWITILRKREGFRLAFDGFDYQKIANYNTDKVEELMQDKEIVRNRLKILATINNSQRFMEIQKEYGTFSNYIWGFVDGKPIDNSPITLKDVAATTIISDALSKDLKKRGFKFLGSTVVYAYMQAIGMVNDHILSCVARSSRL